MKFFYQDEHHSQEGYKSNTKRKEQIKSYLPAWCHYHQQLCSQPLEMDFWNLSQPGKKITIQTGKKG